MLGGNGVTTMYRGGSSGMSPVTLRGKRMWRMEGSSERKMMEKRR